MHHVAIGNCWLVPAGPQGDCTHTGFALQDFDHAPLFGCSYLAQHPEVSEPAGKVGQSSSLSTFADGTWCHSPLLLLPLLLQEPEFFSKHGQCSHPNSSVTWGCDKALAKHYLEGTLKRDFVVDSALSKAAYEASAEYAGVRHGTDGALSATMPGGAVTVDGC